MKKTLVLIFLSFLFFNLASAVEFQMKDSFDQGETLMAKISGNFLDPILKENVFFYRDGHVRISVDYDVAKINDEFYIYALLDKPEGNYSVAIKNVRYMKGAEILEDDITKDFFITNQTADFSINPGFIVTDTDFSVEVQNLQDAKINISINNENSITLKSGEIEKLKFELSPGPEEELSFLTLSTLDLKYEIPVYSFAVDDGIPEEQKSKKVEFDPLELEISMATDSEARRIIYLRNTGEATLENFTFMISEPMDEFVTFSVEDFNDIEPNKSLRIELDFNSMSEEAIVEGELLVDVDGISKELPITLNFVKDFVPENSEEQEQNEENIPVVSQTCAEKNGTVCSDDEQCSGEKVYAKDNLCCLGACEVPKKSSTGKILGWSIVIVIFLFFIWFFKAKYRGAKRNVVLLDIGKRR